MMKERKVNVMTFVVIGLIILGYLGLKVAQKYSFDKEYETSYNSIIAKQQPGSRGFTDLFLSDKNCVHLTFYSGWVNEKQRLLETLSVKIKIQRK